MDFLFGMFSYLLILIFIRGNNGVKAEKEGKSEETLKGYSLFSVVTQNLKNNIIDPSYPKELKEKTEVIRIGDDTNHHVSNFKKKPLSPKISFPTMASLKRERISDSTMAYRDTLTTLPMFQSNTNTTFETRTWSITDIELPFDEARWDYGTEHSISFNSSYFSADQPNSYETTDINYFQNEFIKNTEETKDGIISSTYELSTSKETTKNKKHPAILRPLQPNRPYVENSLKFQGNFASMETYTNVNSSTTSKSYIISNNNSMDLQNNASNVLLTYATHSKLNNLISKLRSNQSPQAYPNRSMSRRSTASAIEMYLTPSTYESLSEPSKANLDTTPLIQKTNISSKYYIDNFSKELMHSRNDKVLPDASLDGNITSVGAFVLTENMSTDIESNAREDKFPNQSNVLNYYTTTNSYKKEDIKEPLSDNYKKNNQNVSSDIVSSKKSKSSNSKTMPGSKYATGLLEDSFFYEQQDHCLSSHETCLWHSMRPNNHKKTCLCSEECKMYGNCCLDYPLEIINVDTHKEKQWSCTKVQKNVGYYLISSCPTSWVNNHVRSQCEDSIDISIDKFRNIPVSSRDTLLAYRNVYCAICNGDLNSGFWSTHLYCPYDVDKDKIIIDDVAINSCEMGFSKPTTLVDQGSMDSIPFVRCDISLINDCPESWKLDIIDDYVLAIWTKCLMIYAPIVNWEYDSIIKYKNIFCAVCNGVLNAASLCPNVFHGTSEIPQQMPAKPALSLLLDMDFTQGGMIVGSQERCPEMHLYDPWMGGCRNIMCGKNYVYQHGYCLLQENRFNQNISEKNISTPNGSLYASCLRVAYTSKEFLISENGSILLKNGHMLLERDEYELVDNETIGVCVGNDMIKYVETFTNLQAFLTNAGIILSIVALCIKICFSLSSKERKKLPSKIVLFLSISLLFAQTLFLFGISRTNYRVLCVTIGILIHYFFLSTFFWMNVLAYDIWKTFSSCKSIVKTIEPGKQLLKYCLYGWLAPLSIVFCSSMANWVFNYPSLNPYYGLAVCWISNKVALVVFFGAPLAILLVCNVYFFVVTAIAIRKTTLASKFALENNSSCGERVQFGLYCKLACIMGLTWAFGFIAAWSDSVVLWYVFIIFNSIQGVYVFFAFTHFRFPIWFEVDKWKDIISRHTTISSGSLTRSSFISKI